MNGINYKMYTFLACFILLNSSTNAQNPIIRDQFTADPSARVFGNKVYVYPSHDVANMGKGRQDWFCMEDYHVFSSSNLSDWTDHGVIVEQNNVPWVNTARYSMWAPDCIEKNGKYYFYFPAGVKDTAKFGRGFRIGVAVAEQPEGPYKVQNEPIANVHGIDPNIFIDNNKQAYLYWSARNIFVAKLKDNMLELDSKPVTIANLPEKGLKEGPYMFERNGIYYLTYPHVSNKTERLEYAIGNSPTGPFNVTGVIMDESPTGCWTNHHSIIQYNNQWYLFYHSNDYSPKFDKNRSIRMDSLFFNDDGTIQKVIPTLRGVGITKASEQIQIDRYSSISKTGTSIELLDTTNTFLGWKTVLSNTNAWIKYNAVDFGNMHYESVLIRANSSEGGVLIIKEGNVNGAVLAEVNLAKDESWNTTKVYLKNTLAGIHHVTVELKTNNKVDIDWIQFVK